MELVQDPSAPKKATTMRFCKECNNMLYPKEDKGTRQLLYACRMCDHQEEAQDFCVYRNEVKAAIETFLPTPTVCADIAADPTLPRTKDQNCPNCSGREAVFFMATNSRDPKMNLYFVCVDCFKLWKETQ